MSSVHLIIPYFGQVPNYFQLFLDSLSRNKIVKVHFFTDINLKSYTLPDNLRVVHCTLLRVRKMIVKFLAENYKVHVAASELLQNIKKICDFKIIYPVLFAKEMKSVPSDQFIGWGDIDVIYGNLSKFINLDCDIIGGHHGHFTAIKNTSEYKNLYKKVSDYEKLCLESDIKAIDEIAYKKVLLEHAGNRVCNLHTNFCDIVPPMFYHLFRPDHERFAKNFFDVTQHKKNISFLRYDDGNLKVKYEDDSVREISYCHLQKRTMSFDTPIIDEPNKISMVIPQDFSFNNYFIDEHEFSSVPPLEKTIIPRVVYLTWKSHDLPQDMAANVEKLKLDNPDFDFKFFDDKDCCDFLDEHFPKDVRKAFDNIKPGAFKADLWRLCVLYINGGIYLDIKFECVNGFSLSCLTGIEHLVSDGPHENFTSIYNGLMACKPGNKMLLMGIADIVRNVSENRYLSTPYAPTGPHLVGKCYSKAKEIQPLYLSHHQIGNTEVIMRGDKIILQHYGSYRSEIPINENYYKIAWERKDIYHGKFEVNVADWLDYSFGRQLRKFYRNSGDKIRLHLIGIPYTITRQEFSHDAFTGKVCRFSPMMKSLDSFEVYHYGVEGSESGADEDIQLLTRAEWDELRIQSKIFLNNKLTREQAIAEINDHTALIGDLANFNTPLFAKFNEKLKPKLQKHFRSPTKDIVCLPQLLDSYISAVDTTKYPTIEVGIGYSGAKAPYRIYESYSWMAQCLGKEDRNPNNYYYVVPHSFDINEFVYRPIPEERKIGFLGRISDFKGCNVIVEIAKRFPDVEFVLCGQGKDYKKYLSQPNIKYLPPISGRERSDFLGSLCAMIQPTNYLEPFGCSIVEAQLCGTPVITTDWGGPTETVKHLKTGLRCHTLADFCYGVELAINGKFDRDIVRKRAVKKYDMFKVAPYYEYIFRSVLDIWTPGKNGYFSPDCHMRLLTQ